MPAVAAYRARAHGLVCFWTHCLAAWRFRDSWLSSWAPALAGSAACIRDAQERLTAASHDSGIVTINTYGAAGKRIRVAAAEILKQGEKQ